MSGTRTLIGLGLSLLTAALVTAQSPQTTHARMIISIGHFYSEQAPVLTRDDLVVNQGIEPVAVLSVVPFREPLELYLLIDHCSSCEPGSKFEELKKFIAAQDPTTKIGVAYIRDGKLELGLKPTENRDAVVKGLNTPEGSKPSNPFSALAELIKGWAPGSSRRVIVMISNGLDPEANGDLRNAPAEAAIEQAERAGIPVFAIYHPSADYDTADWSKLYGGQVQLAHVATETGGEAYFLGFGPVPSLAPFLSDIGDHLANQYVVEFAAKAGAAGSLEDVTVKSKSRNTDVMAPGKVWIPASPASTGSPEKR